MPNDDRALIPVVSSDQSLALSNTNAYASIYPPGFNFATDVSYASAVYHPTTDTYALELAPNTNRTKCPTCNEAFYDRTKMQGHEDDNTAPCRICGDETIWCAVGFVYSSSMTCSDFACAKHSKCFATRKEAVDHAMDRSHGKCFFDDCKDLLAQGKGGYKEVRDHIWYKNWQQYIEG